MFKTLNLLRALFAASFLLFVGNALMLSSNAVILHQMGFSDFAIGNVGAAIYLGALISTLSAPNIIAKVGHIRAYGFFISLYALASLAHIYTSDIYLWAALRFCLGYCYYALLIIIETWINSKARNHNRSRIIAVYEVVFYSGFCLGTLILALKLSSFNIFIIAAFALLLAALPLNLLKIKQPPLSAKRTRSKFPDVFSVSPLALISALIGGFCINGYYSMSQVYFLARGFGVKDVSIFIAAAMAGGFFMQAFIGRISDFYGRKLAILGCSALGLIACLMMMVFDGFLPLCFSCFVFGAGVFCIYALALARASDRVKEPKRLLEIGRSLLFAYSLCSVFSPILLGSALSLWGAPAFMCSYIFMLSALVIFTLTQPKIEPAERATFTKNPGLFASHKIDE